MVDRFSGVPSSSRACVKLRRRSNPAGQVPCARNATTRRRPSPPCIDTIETRLLCVGIYGIYVREPRCAAQPAKPARVVKSPMPAGCDTEAGTHIALLTRRFKASKRVTSAQLPRIRGRYPALCDDWLVPRQGWRPLESRLDVLPIAGMLRACPSM